MAREVATVPIAARAPSRAAISDAELASPSVRVALAGGGTGGHILPGRYLTEWARSRERLDDVLWFQTGRAVEEAAMNGLAERLAPVGLERVALSLEPDGGGAPTLSRLGVRTFPEARRARAALRRHRSQVLVGLGGFTSLPAVLAARSLGVPVILLEINASRGKATQWLAPLATRVLHAWRATMPKNDTASDAKHVWIGPPLAPRFQLGAPNELDSRNARLDLGFDPDAPLVAVLGGSQGAAGLNRFVAEQASFFAANGVQVAHQTGPGRLAEAASGTIEGYRATEYVHDVHTLLTAATLVLCRGGASTLAEVGALARPACVVPYPHHPDRHQEKNALELGRGVQIVGEEKLDTEFACELVRLVGPLGRAERERMSSELLDRVPRDGAARLWSEIERLSLRPPSR